MNATNSMVSAAISAIIAENPLSANILALLIKEANVDPLRTTLLLAGKYQPKDFPKTFTKDGNEGTLIETNSLKGEATYTYLVKVARYFRKEEEAIAFSADPNKGGYNYRSYNGDDYIYKGENFIEKTFRVQEDEI